VRRKQKTEYYYLKPGEVVCVGDEVLFGGGIEWFDINDTEAFRHAIGYPMCAGNFKIRRSNYETCVPDKVICLQAPLRETFFSSDDILNLRIALEATESVEDFLEII